MFFKKPKFVYWVLKKVYFKPLVTTLFSQNYESNLQWRIPKEFPSEYKPQRVSYKLWVTQMTEKNLRVLSLKIRFFPHRKIKKKILEKFKTWEYLAVFSKIILFGLFFWVFFVKGNGCFILSCKFILYSNT